MKYLSIFVMLCMLQLCELSAQTNLENHPDYAGVHAAITDYVEGLYQVDSTRIIRSVHPDLQKRGFYFNTNEERWNDNLDMSFDQLVSLAATWNRSGNRANANSPKRIEIYDINEKTAVGKLTAEWGIDFFQLAKMDGKWMIMNVIWQSVLDDIEAKEQKINTLLDSLGIYPTTLAFHPNRDEIIISSKYNREDKSQYLLILSGKNDQLKIDSLDIERPSRSTFSIDGQYMIYNTYDEVSKEQYTIKRKYDGPDKIGPPMYLSEALDRDNMHYYMMDESENLYYYTYVRNPRSDGGLLYSAFENGEYQEPEMIFPDRPNAVAYSPYLLDARTMLFAQHGIQDNSTDGVYFSTKNEGGWIDPVRLEAIPFSNVIVPFESDKVAFLKAEDNRIKLYTKTYLKRLVKETIANQ